MSSEAVIREDNELPVERCPHGFPYEVVVENGWHFVYLPKPSAKSHAKLCAACPQPAPGAPRIPVGQYRVPPPDAPKPTLPPMIFAVTPPATFTPCTKTPACGLFEPHTAPCLLAPDPAPSLMMDRVAADTCTVCMGQIGPTETRATAGEGLFRHMNGTPGCVYKVRGG